MGKRQDEKLQERVENIRQMLKEDPERHPSAIIATTGLTFSDDLRNLYDFCIKTNQSDITDILIKNYSLIKET